MRLWSFVAVLAFACGGTNGGSPSGTGTGGTGGSSIGGNGGVATGGAGGSGGGVGASGGGTAYTDAIFFATHNSYSPGAELGSIVKQLDDKVRFIELDIHDNEYQTQGYRVGHDAPDNQVALGGEIHRRVRSANGWI